MKIGKCGMHLGLRGKRKWRKGGRKVWPHGSGLSPGRQMARKELPEAVPAVNFATSEIC